MNYTQNQEFRLAFPIHWVRTLGSWLVGPTPLTVTCEEFLGVPEEAIVQESISIRPDTFALPEIDPDEFERVFQWFLS